MTSEHLIIQILCIAHPMILIALYVFMAMATTIAVYEGESSAELVASFITGFTWPLFLVVKIIQKIAR